jgi:4-diphosphocytidyl-2-C-methyl-D-erythritol kinase
MKVYPNAKINIGLNITKRRDDGFHELQTVFYPVPLCDVLEIEYADGFDDEFFQDGPPLDCDSNSNLVQKAVRLLREKYKVPPLRIKLTKRIPVGAGLGGGSSDAAFAVKAINDMEKLGMNTIEMEKLVSHLGSDCAFFVNNKPMYATGRGEVMTSIPKLPDNLIFRIIKPDFSISTGKAYSLVKPQIPLRSLTDDYLLGVEKWAGIIKNDFEQFLFPEYPQLADYKAQLYKCGAIYASMTGSGSALFGIFDHEPILSPMLEAMRVF